MGKKKAIKKVIKEMEKEIADAECEDSKPLDVWLLGKKLDEIKALLKEG